MPHFIRDIVESDFDALWEIEHRAYEFSWTKGILLDCIRIKHPAYVLHDETGHLLGYAFLTVGAGEAHLLNLAVEPTAQNQGIGRQLLAHVLARAPLMRIERIFLEVRPSNAAALKLYEEAGFNEIGRRPGYYPAPNNRREEAIVMALEILPPP